MRRHSPLLLILAVATAWIGCGRIRYEKIAAEAGPRDGGVDAFVPTRVDAFVADAGTDAFVPDAGPPETCGNGRLDASEPCDDGNRTARDGCDAWCRLEPGFACSGAPSTCCRTNLDATVRGTASIDAATGIVTLTPAEQFISGAWWLRPPLDLSMSFDVVLRVKLGADENGADGMAIALQRQGYDALGGAFDAMGVSTIWPSFGATFDTFYNGRTHEQPQDFTLFWSYDTLSSMNALTDGVCLEPSCGDVEDDRFHTARMRWDAPRQRVEVFFDGVLRNQIVRDLVAVYFADDPTGVIFGVGASTGGLTTRFQMCLNSLTHCGDGALEGLETCDDGNTNDGDGCSGLCERE